MSLNSILYLIINFATNSYITLLRLIFHILLIMFEYLTSFFDFPSYFRASHSCFIKKVKTAMTICKKKRDKECKVMRTNKKKKNDNFVPSICKYYNKFREPY